MSSPRYSILGDSGEERAACGALGLVQDETFWFSDGSLVLVAGTSAFKIYHGVLASQSAVFADMLSLPRSSTDPSINGCPILELLDSPEDLRYLLQVLFPPPMMSPGGTSSFPRVSAVVRLSHKYQMDALLRQGIDILTGYYTTTYSQWLKRDEYPHLKPLPIHAIDAVYLARLTETDSMLPTALLQCSFLEERVITGHKREDGTCVKLSDTDVQRGIAARRQLMEADLAGLRSLQKIPYVQNGQDCKSPAQCRLFMLNFLSAALLGFDGYDRASLLPWRQVVHKYRSKRRDEVKDMCASCLSTLRSQERWNKGRHGTWKRLPRIMGVQIKDWNDPEQEQT
ncbi:hypothetical protein C8Q80DRAFT_1258645 [Daedaleopsis nitida]|nr:hypothetical protein C8Q80DRAFT_1258645 [Daedaleopsis nitida]